MKKIILFMSFIILLLAFIPFVSAYETDSIEIINESEREIVAEKKGFSFGPYLIINGTQPNWENYASTGYITLNMGVSNQLSFSLLDFLDRFSYLNEYQLEIASWQVEVTFEKYYTSCQTCFFKSWSSGWIVDGNTMKYTSSSPSMTDYLTLSMSWSNLLSGHAPFNDTGGIRFRDAYLTVYFTEPIPLDIDVNDQYQLLPEIYDIKDGLEVVDIQLINLLTKQYRITVKYNASLVSPSFYYNISITFPENTDIQHPSFRKEYMRLYQDQIDGYYLVYTVSESPPTLDFVDLVETSIILYQIYLDQQTYYEIAYVKVNGITTKTWNKHVWLHLFFEQEIEDLLSINIDFRYRYKSITGVYQPYRYINHFYSNSSNTLLIPEQAIDWKFRLFYGNLTPEEVLHRQMLKQGFQIITPMQPSELSPEVVTKYVENLNRSLINLQTENIYRIHLGSFWDADLINKWDVEISDIVIVEMAYKYDGVLYQSPYELIEQTILPTDQATSPFDWWHNLFPDLSRFLSVSLGIVSLGILVFVGYWAYKKIKGK